MYVTHTMARLATELQRQRLPDPVVHHAKRAVIDWYAAALPGTQTAATQALENVLKDDLDHGKAQLVLGRSATAKAAALINGTAAHAAELDDSFREAMYHPGAATIAAALAVAQDTQASGADFLYGVVAGYEVSTRIGVVMGRPHYRYWHNTGTIGVFGAAAAAAAIHQLDDTAFAHALAIAATFSAGLQQTFWLDAMSKPLHAGRAAEAGLLAAQLARQGVTSSLDILEGEAGLGRAMSNGPDWSQIGDTFGHDFHITRLTFKNHVGCGHVFPAIDGALALQQMHAIDPGQIAWIHIATYRPALDMACHEQPATEHEARFSLKYMVATALMHGGVRMNAYSPERLACPATRALMKNISAAIDPDIDAGFPQRRAARVEIALKTGEHYVLLQPNRKGDPEAALTDDELNSKFSELAVPVIGQEPASRLLQRLWRLEKADTLRQ